MIVIKGLKIEKKQIKYIFPRDIQSISSFKEILSLRKVLQTQFNALSLPNFPYLQTKKKCRRATPTESKNILMNRLGRQKCKIQPSDKIRETISTLEIFCRYCPSSLLYEFDQRSRSYILRNFRVEHIHGRNSDNHEIWTNDSENTFKNATKIYTYNGLNMKEVQSQITEKVNSLQHNVNELNQNGEVLDEPIPDKFEAIVKYLHQKGYFVYYEPEPLNEIGLPDLLMFISPEMKAQYLKYHKCIGFDYTFNLIHEKPMNSDQYLVGTISGLNEFRRLTIYALVISIKESKEATITVFKQFFKCMEDKHPQTIVTDQAPGIIWGLRDLIRNREYRGEAYWDTFHTLKNYKMRNPPLKQKMRMMIRQKCKYSFQKMYLQAVLLARTEQQMDSLHRFVHESQKYCMSQIQPMFVGMGVSNSQNEFVNALIKNIITLQEKYVKVVYKLAHFIEKRNVMNQAIRMPNMNIEQSMNRKDLKLLRLSLNIRFLSFFFTQYFRLCYVNFVYKDEDNKFFYIQDRVTTHRVDLNEHQLKINGRESFAQQEDQLKEYYSVERPEFESSESKYYRYLCSCQFMEKTGIPCEHILKVVIKMKQGFLQHIYPSYVIKDPNNLAKCVRSASDYSLPINKRGSRSHQRIYESYFIERPHSNAKLPEGYITALPSRKNIRDMGNSIKRRKAKFLNMEKKIKHSDNIETIQKAQAKSDYFAPELYEKALMKSRTLYDSQKKKKKGKYSKPRLSVLNRNMVANSLKGGQMKSDSQKQDIQSSSYEEFVKSFEKPIFRFHGGRPRRGKYKIEEDIEGEDKDEIMYKKWMRKFERNSGDEQMGSDGEENEDDEQIEGDEQVDDNQIQSDQQEVKEGYDENYGDSEAGDDDGDEYNQSLAERESQEQQQVSDNSAWQNNQENGQDDQEYEEIGTFGEQPNEQSIIDYGSDKIESEEMKFEQWDHSSMDNFNSFYDGSNSSLSMQNLQSKGLYAGGKKRK